MNTSMKMHEIDLGTDPGTKLGTDYGTEHDSELEQVVHAPGNLYYKWQMRVYLTRARVGIVFNLPTQALRTQENRPKRP